MAARRKHKKIDRTSVLPRQLTGIVKLLAFLLCLFAPIRLVNALGLWIAGALFELPVSGPLSVWTALVTGLPGVAIQWIVLPLLIRALKKSGVLRYV